MTEHLVEIIFQTLAIGAFMGGVALRLEHRLTRLETKVEHVEKILEGLLP